MIINMVRLFSKLSFARMDKKGVLVYLINFIKHRMFFLSKTERQYLVGLEMYYLFFSFFKL